MVEILRDVFQEIQSTIIQHWLKHGLVPNRRQAFVGTNDGLVVTHIYVTQPRQVTGCCRMAVVNYQHIEAETR